MGGISINGLRAATHARFTQMHGFKSLQVGQRFIPATGHTAGHSASQAHVALHRSHASGDILQLLPFLFRLSLLAGGGFFASGHLPHSGLILGDGTFLLLEYLIHRGGAPPRADTGLLGGGDRRCGSGGCGKWVHGRRSRSISRGGVGDLYQAFIVGGECIRVAGWQGRQGVGAVCQATRGLLGGSDRQSVSGGSGEGVRERRAKCISGVGVGDLYQAFRLGGDSIRIARGWQGRQGVGTASRATRDLLDGGRRLSECSGSDGQQYGSGGGGSLPRLLPQRATKMWCAMVPLNPNEAGA